MIWLGSLLNTPFLKLRIPNLCDGLQQLFPVKLNEIHPREANEQFLVNDQSIMNYVSDNVYPNYPLQQDKIHCLLT